MFEPGARFAYDDSASVVLALLAERVSGVALPELVRARVCEPAGMRDTAFSNTTDGAWPVSRRLDEVLGT